MKPVEPAPAPETKRGTRRPTRIDRPRGGEIFPTPRPSGHRVACQALQQPAQHGVEALAPGLGRQDLPVRHPEQARRRRAGRAPSRRRWRRSGRPLVLSTRAIVTPSARRSPIISSSVSWRLARHDLALALAVPLGLDLGQPPLGRAMRGRARASRHPASAGHGRRGRRRHTRRSASRRDCGATPGRAARGC